MAVTTLKTSKQGIGFLERHEGVVLKAYRDPVGIWTIGAGLTKASGVVTPKGGMHITKAEASQLLAQALLRNYEPTVNVVMPGAAQYEFDGGVSFHFNTGAIKRASWVKFWRNGVWPEVKRRLCLWNKAGGRVLKGLTRRRTEEYYLILNGSYSGDVPQMDSSLAQIVVSMSVEEIADMRDDFSALGFDPGSRTEGVAVDVVRAFQSKHGLTIDGKIGRATLSTVQRMRDAKRKAATAGAATAGGAVAGAAVPTIDALPFDPSTLGAGGGIAWLLWVAWSYRDALAAMVETSNPEMAKWLREL